ncbi:MAG: DUF4625 domain-containing protein [Cytophagaceae bacterium]|nr:DUF4625 domain-containing protein [Cytophagaceae bacterium]
MNKIYYFPGIIFCCLITFTSCDKEEQDVNVPEITIANPQEGVTYNVGDSIPMDIEVSDRSIGEFRIHIYKNSDSSQRMNLYPMSSHNAKRYKVDFFWVSPPLKKAALAPALPEPHTMYVDVTDNMGNSTRKTVNFLIQ